jgi:hypothetical protein
MVDQSGQVLHPSLGVFFSFFKIKINCKKTHLIGLPQSSLKLGNQKIVQV